MKYVLTALALIALSVPAFAQGENVTVKVAIHVTGGADPVEPTDNGSIVNEYAPAAYTTVRAYVCITDLTSGFSSFVFKLNDVLTDYPGVCATQSFVNLLPDNLAIGNAFGDTENPGTPSDGITLATACFGSDYEVVLAGYAEYFYLGGAFPVEIMSHGNPLWDRWIVDCQDPGQINEWCIWKNAGVGGATPPEGDEGCDANTPTEDATWGSIKALYQ